MVSNFLHQTQTIPNLVHVCFLSSNEAVLNHRFVGPGPYGDLALDYRTALDNRYTFQRNFGLIQDDEHLIWMKKLWKRSKVDYFLRHEEEDLARKVSAIRIEEAKVRAELMGPPPDSIWTSNEEWDANIHLSMSTGYDVNQPSFLCYIFHRVRVFFSSFFNSNE